MARLFSIRDRTLFWPLFIKGMWQYIEAKLRNVAKDKTKQYGHRERMQFSSVLVTFLSLAIIYCFNKLNA